jgi:hypothetical protein
MELTLVQDATAATEPVSLTQAKSYLLIDNDTTQDGTIQTLITAARLEAEKEHGRELSPKQWLLTFDSFPQHYYREEVSPALQPPYGDLTYWFAIAPNFIRLLDPLLSVDAFTWTDNNGNVTAMVENTDYIVDTNKHPGVVCPTYGNTWPTGPFWPSSAVQITFTAGFGPAAPSWNTGLTPAPCPLHLQQGMSLLISQWYEGRIPFEAIRFVAELPYSVSSLFRNNKLWKF